MAKNQLISVIIPTFNEAKNIERLLISLQKQTYDNFEIIVVDDESKDDTVEIAKKYTDKVYSRKHEERSVQRNFGYMQSHGDYLLFLDADMELSSDVLESCCKVIKRSDFKALIIPEKTLGESFMARVRNFEREMYMGDITIEVARFFDRGVFKEFGGYDEDLTGAEDYDLPARIMKKYKIGWANSVIYHHENELTLWQLLKKKYYYASLSVGYADKHPELIFKQGAIIFRKAYLRHTTNFLRHPILGVSFLFIRTLVTFAAIMGFIKIAGIKKFFITLYKMFKYI